MLKIDSLTLRTTRPAALRQFYCDVLGMVDLGDGRVGYHDREAALQFIAAEQPYMPKTSDLYWKIALSVPNIELACEQLQARGIPVTEPRQFRDVGYLAKFTDPEGFVVELIDHWFQGDRPKENYDPARLGGGAHLSLISLRSSDIAEIEPDILGWGMSKLSVQPVAPYGFTLHFYAFTDEAPPDPNLDAIENRTWVYQRPYTVLEIQHVYELETETLPAENAGGYGGVTIASSDKAPMPNVLPSEPPKSSAQTRLLLRRKSQN